MKRLLTFILIIIHILINCAWASAHLEEGFDIQGSEPEHVHLDTLFSVLDTADNDEYFSSYNHDNEAHTHLTYCLLGSNSFNFEQTIVQKRSDIRIPFQNHAFSPPIRPPIA